MKPLERKKGEDSSSSDVKVTSPLPKKSTSHPPAHQPATTKLLGVEKSTTTTTTTPSVVGSNKKTLQMKKPIRQSFVLAKGQALTQPTGTANRPNLPTKTPIEEAKLELKRLKSQFLYPHSAKKISSVYDERVVMSPGGELTFTSLPPTSTESSKEYTTLRDKYKLVFDDVVARPWQEVQVDWLEVTDNEVPLIVSHPTVVHISPHTIGKGAFREVYYLQVTRDDGYRELFVVKMFRNPKTTSAEAKRGCITDVRIQFEATKYAELYNRTNPPKCVYFLPAAVIHVSNPESCPVPLLKSQHYAAVEPLIVGKYVKWSSNTTFINDNDLRQTPTAFSHFSYEVSGGKSMVCDIQGVEKHIGYVFTDPQVHGTTSRWGVGDMGRGGMRMFFTAHECNDLCRRLMLAPSNFVDDDPIRHLEDTWKDDPTTPQPSMMLDQQPPQSIAPLTVSVPEHVMQVELLQEATTAVVRKYDRALRVGHIVAVDIDQEATMTAVKPESDEKVVPGVIDRHCEHLWGSNRDANVTVMLTPPVHSATDVDKSFIVNTVLPAYGSQSSEIPSVHIRPAMGDLHEYNVSIFNWTKPMTYLLIRQSLCKFDATIKLLQLANLDSDHFTPPVPLHLTLPANVTEFFVQHADRPVVSCVNVSTRHIVLVVYAGSETTPPSQPHDCYVVSITLHPTDPIATAASIHPLIIPQGCVPLDVRFTDHSGKAVLVGLNDMYILLCEVAKANPKGIPTYTVVKPFGDEHGSEFTHRLHSIYVCPESRRLFFFRHNETYFFSLALPLLKARTQYAARQNQVERWHLSDSSGLSHINGDPTRCWLCTCSDMGMIQLWCTMRLVVLMIFPSPSAQHSVRRSCFTEKCFYVFAENFDVLAWKLPQDVECEEPVCAYVSRRVWLEDEIISMVPVVVEEAEAPATVEDTRVVVSFVNGMIAVTGVAMWPKPKAPEL